MSKWNLDYLYKSEEEFLNCLGETTKRIEELKSYEGKLHEENAINFVSCCNVGIGRTDCICS